MFRKAAVTALMLAAVAVSTSGASAQPGISSLAQPAPIAGQTGDVAKVGWRRGRLKFWLGKHRLRNRFVHIVPNCHRYLKLYKATGNPHWKNKFVWCKHL